MTTPFAGPVSSILMEINIPGLYSATTATTPNLSGLAYIGFSGKPDLPSQVTEIVNMTQNAYLGANVEIGGSLTVDGTTNLTVAASSIATSMAVNPGPLSVTGGAAAGGLFTVQNTTSTPSDATSKFTANAAGDRTLGVLVSGDSFQRWRMDSTGLMQWGPGNATQDLNLYRLSPGTLRTDNNFSVGGTIVGGTNTVAGNIQPDGLQAAGSVSRVADAGHVHQEVGSLLTYTQPSAAAWETLPRSTATNSGSTVVTSVQYMRGIGLPANQIVSKLSFLVSSVIAASGVTHGYYFLTDINRVVLATSADQGSSTIWGTASTLVTLAMSASATIASGGMYYLGLAITATTTPAFVQGVNVAAGMLPIVPVLYGSSGTSATPPAVGSTVTTLSTASAFNLWGYVS